MSETAIFALDIGTRKVAGLLLHHTSTGYTLEHASLHEQLPGAMQDGQIHDIQRTAQIISAVREELEAASGLQLSEAAVAAAGRSLLTREATAELTVPIHHRLNREDVKRLELAAVSQALNSLEQSASQGVSDTYLCVGYSTTQYYLDDSPITSLVGHQAARAGVQIIATFLPSIVVNSLSAALQESGLSMESLTLEPIAAMHLVVPATMRMLNIALVDIGAGTSDIAIADQGTIKAYGMVPAAGDEITQALAAHYLLDFMVAEHLKRSLVQQEPLHCSDVLGNPLQLSSEEVLHVLEPAIDDLVEQIAAEIVRLNETPPKGVVIIGGGGLTPGFADKLAARLGLPDHLVRLRTRENLNTIHGCPDFAGPQVITPIAIGAAHLEHLAMDLQKVTVNGTPYQFLRRQHSTVGDAILHAGLSKRDLYGRPGEAITVTLNDERVTIPGTMGGMATIRMNGQNAGLRTPLVDNATLEIDEPSPGAEARAQLGDLVDMKQEPLFVRVNDQRYSVTAEVAVNGHRQGADYVLQDGDSIVVHECRTIAQALEHLHMMLPQSITVTVNGTSTTVACHRKIEMDGRELSLASPIYQGQEPCVTIRRPTVAELLRNKKSGNALSISVTVDGEPTVLTMEEAAMAVNGRAANMEQPLYSGDRVELPEQTAHINGFILSDIFRHMAQENLPKGQVDLYVNGEKSGFTRPLKTGDAIEIVQR